MTDNKTTRLSKIARELNVGIATIVDFLNKKGIKIDSNPNTKVTPDQYNLLIDEFSSDLSVKKESEKLNLKHLREKHETISINDIIEEGDEEEQEAEEEQDDIVNDKASSPVFETETEKKLEREKDIKLNILGKIDINTLDKPKKADKKETTEEREIKACRCR